MGTMYDGYHVSQTLGSGQFGVVCLGSSPVGQVAIKFIKEQSDGASDVQKEFDILLSLRSHINVTNVCSDKIHLSTITDPSAALCNDLHDVIHSNVHAIIMDYCGGGDLFEKVASMQSFPENCARFYFRQLLDGIEWCHSKGVYHLDIKPENLMFDLQFNLKIADFGLSKAVAPGDQAVSNQRCGTRAYMHPSVLAETTYDMATADLWSCGVVLFILLMGSPPWGTAAPRDGFFSLINNHGGDLKAPNGFWATYQGFSQQGHHLWTQDSMDLLTAIFDQRPGADSPTIAGLRAMPFLQAPDPAGGLEAVRNQLGMSVASYTDNALRQLESDENSRALGDAVICALAHDNPDAFSAEVNALPEYRIKGTSNKALTQTRFFTREAPSVLLKDLQQELFSADAIDCLLEGWQLDSVTEPASAEAGFKFEVKMSRNMGSMQKSDAIPIAPALFDDGNKLEFVVSAYRSVGTEDSSASAPAVDFQGGEEFVIDFQRLSGNPIVFTAEMFQGGVLPVAANKVSAFFALDGQRLVNADDFVCN